HAQEVSTLGHELYKRLCDMGSHWGKVGRNLSTAVDSYNKAVGTLESRVFVSARKLKELGAASDHHELEILEPIDQIPRKIQSLS
ncbi:MAG: DNA recombination protein RmuC, partial [Simkania negevensis]|nr:DNA recombination protein RmuC [Simkania negevensis]